MRITDWLTYTDINQLKQLNRFYQCDCNDRSKNELICSLLQRMNRTSLIKEIVKELPREELRFLQLIVLDASGAYTMEELVAKGRAALLGKEGEPRKLIASVLKKGWLFRGYSHNTHNFYEIPTDTKERLTNLFIESYDIGNPKVQPDFYRDEENLIIADLYSFLEYLHKDIVRIANDGSIYRNQQKVLLQSLCVIEEPVTGKGPRFGFGRNYHLYPDRFSLIYDYAFYKNYIAEDAQGCLCLTEIGNEKLLKKDVNEGRHLYRFWIRLYRKPIPNLPIIIQWLGLLSYSRWIPLDHCFEVSEEWLAPYYYESVENIFRKIIQILLHLGVLKVGTENGVNYITLTLSGINWIQGISVFKEEVIEEGFIPKPKTLKSR